MPIIERQARVPHTATEMYDLVNDLESYPAFLPWCSGVQVNSRTEHEVRARLVVTKAGISKSFMTHNTLRDGNRIEMRLVDGPFQRLQGSWHFASSDEVCCDVYFRLEFEWMNKLMGLALGCMIEPATERMVAAFFQRAKDIYG